MSADRKTKTSQQNRANSWSGHRGGKLAQDYNSHKHGAGQHKHADIDCGMELLVAEQLPRQAEGRAGGAAGKIEPLTERARNRSKRQQHHGDQKKYAGNDPGGGSRTGMQRLDRDETGGHGQRQECHGMHQGDDGALTVGQDNVTAHGESGDLVIARDPTPARAKAARSGGPGDRVIGAAPALNIELIHGAGAGAARVTA
jgi:hypothetical protein